MSKKRKQLHKKPGSWELPEDRERVAELRRLGWSAQHAQMLRVIEITLDCILATPDPGRAKLIELVCIALSHQPVRLAVAPLYGWPEHEVAWRTLASEAPPPYADFCAVMASLAGLAEAS